MIRPVARPLGSVPVAEPVTPRRVRSPLSGRRTGLVRHFTPRRSPRPREATDRLHVEQRRGAVSRRSSSRSGLVPDQSLRRKKLRATRAGFSAEFGDRPFTAVLRARFSSDGSWTLLTSLRRRGVPLGGVSPTRSSQRRTTKLDRAAVKTFEISSSWGMVPQVTTASPALGNRAGHQRLNDQQGEQLEGGRVLRGRSYFASVKARAPVSEDRGSREVRDRRSARGLAHNIVRAVGRVTCSAAPTNRRRSEGSQAQRIARLRSA